MAFDHMQTNTAGIPGSFCHSFRLMGQRFLGQLEGVKLLSIIPKMKLKNPIFPGNQSKLHQHSFPLEAEAFLLADFPQSQPQKIAFSFIGSPTDSEVLYGLQLISQRLPIAQEGNAVNPLGGDRSAFIPAPLLKPEYHQSHQST